MHWHGSIADQREARRNCPQGRQANYYNVESGMWYWVSKCRKDGNDALYPATIEIDEDVREEYWTDIRKQPANKHLTKFKSPGKPQKASLECCLTSFYFDELRPV